MLHKLKNLIWCITHGRKTISIAIDSICFSRRQLEYLADTQEDITNYVEDIRKIVNGDDPWGDSADIEYLLREIETAAEECKRELQGYITDELEFGSNMLIALIEP